MILWRKLAEHEKSRGKSIVPFMEPYLLHVGGGGNGSIIRMIFIVKGMAERSASRLKSMSRFNGMFGYFPGTAIIRK